MAAMMIESQEEIAAKGAGEDVTQYWSGICNTCGAEWLGMDSQNVCPCCGSDDCDLIEEDTEGDGIL